MDSSDNPNSRRPRIYYGWWMVVITSAMVFIASGIFFRGFTVFVPAIRDALGINQAQTNLIFSLARAPGGGLEGPITGWLIDKFGNRKLLVPAILLAVAGYITLSFFVRGFLSFALVYLLMVSLGSSIAFQHAMFAGINQWFRRRRSLAISILAAMGSLGGLTLVPSMNLLITHQGWQRATLLCGLLYLLILLPLTIPFRNRPEDMGLLPDGDETLSPTSAPSRALRRRQQELRDYTVGEAMHTRAYWQLMVGSGLRQMATLGILVSIVPILETKGLSNQGAANLTGLMFGINFVSRLLMGYMGDRWSKSLILGVNLGLESLAALCLLFGYWSGPGIALVWMFVIFEGIGDGAGILVWATLGEYYGRDRFATLRGYITFAFSWALIASPVYAGWVFDYFGSYDWALIPGVICSAIASLCFFAIKKPPPLIREDAAPTSPAEASI